MLATLSEIIGGPIDDAEKYNRAYMEFIMRVDAHERSEEQTIYAALSSDQDVRPIALQSMEEHRIIRNLLKDLADVEITEETWLPRLVVVNNIIALHLQIEEGNVLPLVQQTFDSAKREQFDKDFISKRDSIIQQLHK